MTVIDPLLVTLYYIKEKNCNRHRLRTRPDDKQDMDGIIIILIAFCIVLLIVSLTYVLTNIRHKERMMLLEKGKDPNLFDTPYSRKAPLKWGMLLLGVGFGFFSAFILDHYVFPSSFETEPVYPAMIFFFGGLGLVVFYYRFSGR